MSASNLIPQIPEEEITPIIAALLEILQKQAEEIQGLKDEIARLKGQKPKPKIRPSNLDKNTNAPDKKKDPKPKRKTRSKTKELVIHEDKYYSQRTYRKDLSSLIIKIILYRTSSSPAGTLSINADVGKPLQGNKLQPNFQNM